MKRLFSLSVILSLICIHATAQTKNQAYLDYIDQYSAIAIQQQIKHKIPAAITIAQGLLESAAGRSELATKANNHFGIKCTSDWKGRTYGYNDGEHRNECYRRYPSVEDSYEDHSLFLLRKRYESLFELPIGDYKGWARGLKACGYATDPKYPEKLIKLIELYDLQSLTMDKDLKAGGFVKDEDADWQEETLEHEVIMQAQHNMHDYVLPPMEDFELYEEHASGYRNGVRYIIAARGETFATLSYFLNMRERALRRYNDAMDTRELKEGDMVYIYPKKKKAGRKYTYYYVKPGDDAWEIAQKYGIRLKHLYKINNIPYGTPLAPQQRLQLR